MPQSFDCDTFCCLGFERTALSPGVRLLSSKLALKEDTALSGIAAHLQGRRHNFTDYDALVRKMPYFRDDGTLAKTAH